MVLSRSLCCVHIVVTCRYSGKRQEDEKSYNPGRHEEWKNTTKAARKLARFKFMASVEACEWVDTLVRTLLRLWQGPGSTLTPPFKGTKKGLFTIHDAIVFCGDIGVYLVMQLGLPEFYETLFIDLLYCLESCTLKFYKVCCVLRVLRILVRNTSR
jgi:hypothetical protein